MVAAGTQITFSPIVPGEYKYTVLQSKAGFVDRNTEFTITVTLDCTSFLWQVLEDMPETVKQGESVSWAVTNLLELDENDESYTDLYCPLSLALITVTGESWMTVDTPTLTFSPTATTPVGTYLYTVK